MARIINPRGTSGSGKTTAVKEVMRRLGQDSGLGLAHHASARKRPLYYSFPHPVRQPDPLLGAGHGRVIVMGHYETACGGCDTITELDYLFDLVSGLADQGADIIMEGLLLSGEVRRTVELSQRHPLFVLGLDTGIEQCVRGVESRRLARGDERPLNPTNTIAKDKTVRRVLERLRNESGANVRMVSQATCADVMWELLNER
jgi:hypothetical protein